MTPQDFIAKWRAVELKERTASKSHFIDLSRQNGDERLARLLCLTNECAVEQSAQEHQT